MKKIDITELSFAEYNPRKITDKQLDDLRISIEKFGFVEPVIINKDNTIIGGHQRVKVAELMGLKEVPFIRLDLSKDDEKELNIRLNKAGGVFDLDLLSEYFDVDDLIDYGFEMEELDLIIEEDEPVAHEDNFQEGEGDVNTNIKLGDIIEFKVDNEVRHRLMCGDSTDSDSVSKLMEDRKADIAFTSPPYNAGDNVRGNFYDSDTDDKPSNEYVNFLCDFSINTINHAAYSFINIQLLESNKYDLIDYQYNMKEYIKDILIWNKSTAPPHINKGTFSTKWEYVIAMSSNSKSRAFPCKWQGKYPNVIDTENASGNKYADIHKATFPVSFPSWIISRMDFAETVLDVFMGTGTTMVAAHQLNRRCYGMELDPKYCQVIVDRMKNLDSSITVTVNGEQLEC